MNPCDQKQIFEDLKKLLTLKKAEGYEIKELEEKGDMMGSLVGFQFDSDMRGGYVYFWSSGNIGRQLLDYETGEEIIEDTTGEMTQESAIELLRQLENNL